MPLTLVHHDTGLPALFGAAAAALIARHRLEKPDTTGPCLLHLPTRYGTGTPEGQSPHAAHADCQQHVYAKQGLELGPSGLIWYERLTGDDAQPASTLDEILSAAEAYSVIVPIHPLFMKERSSVTQLRSKAEQRNIAIQDVHATFEEGQIKLDVNSEPLAYRDEWGRISLTPHKTKTSQPLTIGFVGWTNNHKDAYPASFAALADAADQVGISLQIRLLEPQSLSEPSSDSLGGFDALLLPGGSQMEVVAGQILAAKAGYQNRLPTLGLCLGMQSMTTAIAQIALGSDSVNLAEADPDAPTKSFTAMAGCKTASGTLLPSHRTGAFQTHCKNGSTLKNLLGATYPARFNHRFRLNPDLAGTLQRAGLELCASDESGAIIEAIEAKAHPFYMGMQGHPELDSTPQKPHPIFVAFIGAALRHKNQNS